jgi:Ring finger domain
VHSAHRIPTAHGTSTAHGIHAAHAIPSVHGLHGLHGMHASVAVDVGGGSSATGGVGADGALGSRRTSYIDFVRSSLSSAGLTASAFADMLSGAGPGGLSAMMGIGSGGGVGGPPGGMDYEALLRLDDTVKNRRAAKKGDIRKLRTQRAKQADTELSCCICMCDVELGEELRVLPCSHKYHKVCIDQWLLTNACCPVDLKRVDGKNF